MELSQVLEPTVVVPPHILDGQRLSATEHYPEHVFSMEFDVLLLEEVHRSKIHRICHAHQLQSFDILLDNLLGTKRLKLTEYSVLHGKYLQHQDYPTGLHLQHRFVQLLQKSEHSSRWAPRSQDLARLLSRRNKYVRMLKEQAKSSKAKVAFFKPTIHYSRTPSDATYPGVFNAQRYRTRYAPKVGRRPLKDKSFCLSLPIGFKRSIPKKSLPRRKARKGDSYQEQLIPDLDFPEPDLYDKRPESPQQSPTNAASPMNLVPRKPEAGAMSSSNPSPIPVPVTTPDRLAISPAYQNRFTPDKVSGISKPSFQKHLRPVETDFLKGHLTGVFREPGKFSRLSTTHDSAITPIELDKLDDTESAVGAQALEVEASNTFPSVLGHEIDAKGGDIAERLLSMETSLRGLKETVENKMTSIEKRMSLLEQAFPINEVAIDSGVRKDIQNVRLEVMQMASLQSEIRKEIVTLSSSMRKGKSSEENEASADKKHGGTGHSNKAQESMLPRQGMDPCHGEIKQSENNASTLHMKPIETEDSNDECIRNTSSTSQPGEATNAKNWGANLGQEEGHPSMFSTFATRLQQGFFLPEGSYRRVLGGPLKHKT